MKKHVAILSFFALLFVSVQGIAQTAAAHTAVLSYDQASLDNAVKAKTFEFTMKNLSEAQAAAMQKNGSYYTGTFTVSYTNSAADKVFRIDFKNDAQMKILYRYFITNNISDVIYKGEQIKAESFFKQWM